MVLGFWGLRFRVECSGFRLQGGIRVLGLRFRVECSGFRLKGGCISYTLNSLRRVEDNVGEHNRGY